ncbi:cyanophycinase [Bacillus songklensis]|uniref:Cyanophycinase n=1 Tax=Bacillus songklensis TaxID=1069116 RepID=A0ABV8AZW3_9BACI
MHKGELLIIGGSEGKEHETEILDKFIELSRARGGAVGILPTASQIPDQVSAEYVETFRRLGAQEIEIIGVDSREKAESPEISELVSKLSALFITGGNQKRLKDLIKGTALYDTLYEKWSSGMVIGGTSAGASIMGEHMIVSAQTKAKDDVLEVDMDEGFGLLKNMIIDQHFSQRARFGRLLHAIAQESQTIGIGIDENTAILVKGNEFEVYGQHQVRVFDGKNRTYVDVNIADNGSEEATMSGIQLHTLTKGYRFDLSKRELLNRKGE